ncbi:MAG: tRNA (N(6)-L-threonylcarbamoyladenosine(37)-C(2))-methylthiotransferase MtaB [Pseudomonadota bacterium]
MANNKVITFGCRLNSYESAVITKHLKEQQLNNTIVINSCSVTAEAERQARQTIRKLKRTHPNHKIIVTGCAAQNNPKQFTAMKEVNQVLGNHDKLQSSTYRNHEKVVVNDIMTVKTNSLHLIESFDQKTRAFLQVQNGCDHRCTFCNIPYARGNSRSVPLGEIVAQVKQLVYNDYQEIVLSGVDISAYGQDLPGKPTLGRIMHRLLELVPELPRLRLSSIDVAEIDADLLNLLKTQPRFMPYFHISMQAGNDMVLKRMKRRHSRQDIIDFCQQVKSIRPHIALGADIIAGFPTETEAMFNETHELIAETGIAYLHVFPYSPRRNTPASRMPQVAANIRKERAKQLRQLGLINLKQFLQTHVGTEQLVLVESNNLGRTETNAEVVLSNSYAPGSIIKTTIKSVNNKQLVA